MVIIKKDEHDYVTFTNSSRVYKMSVTPASDNISTFLSGNGAVSNDNASLSTPSNNQNNNTITMTIRRDSSQQQLEKLQQYTQQQNQLMQQQQQQQQNQQLAKAQLNCRPNSHPFPVSLLSFQLKKQMWFLTFRFRAFTESYTSPRGWEACQNRKSHSTHKSQRQQWNIRL